MASEESTKRHQSYETPSLPRHLVAYDPHTDRLLAHGGKGSSDELLVHVGLQLGDNDFQRLDKAEAHPTSQRFPLHGSIHSDVEAPARSAPCSDGNIWR